MSALTLASTVKLPITGRSMPILGLGVYQNYEPGEAVAAALACGYRHIDSARMYRNERQVGEAVHKSGVPRSDVFITSKIYHPEFGYDKALAAVQDSLSNIRLSTSPSDTNASNDAYYDLYLIHSPIGGKELRLETYRALLEAQRRGWVRTVGVSNYSGRHIDEIKDAGLPLPSVNQVELHPFCQQRPIVSYCTQNGILVQAYTPLIRGDLSHPVIVDIAKKLSKDPAQVVLRWSLQHSFIPLPKSAHAERVRSNAEVFGWELSAEDMQKLDALDKGKEGAVTWNPVDAD